MQAEYEIIRAEGGGLAEVIIWVVVAIVWAVAQGITKSRQKKELQKGPGQKAKPKGALQKDLETFFEELSRQQQPPKPAGPAGTPPPPPPPAQPRRRVAQAMPPPAATRTPSPPDTAPRGRQMSRRTTEAANAIEEHAASMARRIAEAQPFRQSTEYKQPPLVEETRSQNAARTPMSTNLFLSGKGFSFPTVRLTSRLPRKPPAKIRALFRNPNTLRNAYIARVALGPPRGLQRPDFIGD